MLEKYLERSSICYKILPYRLLRYTQISDCLVTLAALANQTFKQIRAACTRVRARHVQV